MPFSAGIIYSCQAFLRIIVEDPISPDQFGKIFREIEVANSAAVLSLSQRCGWVSINEHGVLCPTERGHALLNIGDPIGLLRAQLLDLIFLEQPRWAKRMPLGRDEAKRFMPSHIKQCFADGELLDGYDDETVDWWD